MLLWKEPVYTGRSPIAGYYVDMKEKDAQEEQWRSVNEKPVQKKFLKVNSLRFKHWCNSVSVGSQPSMASSCPHRSV